jgi:predicted nucleic acid-binding protein
VTGAKKYLLDANILIRLLMEGVPAQTQAAKRLFEEAKSGDARLVIPFTAVSETMFTLGSFYGISRRIAADAVLSILKSPGVSTTAPDWVFDALDEFGRRKSSFGDACIAAEARVLKLTVASFDGDFEKYVGVTRFKPE